MSQAEDALLNELRWLGIPQPVREYRFTMARRWRFDFAWPENLLAVEVEGGTWTGSRHTTGKGFAADCEKYNEAALLGWKVLRVTPDHVKDGRAVYWIKQGLVPF